ncbi:MAG: ATP-binding cassette domain-containing protein [Acidobacteriota bacterium]
MKKQTILECLGLTFSYSGASPIFDHLDMSVESGSFTHVQGPSGSGKSTLLRLLNRLEEPGSGTIHFKGHPVEDYSPPVLRRSIAYIQQTPTLVPGTVRDNLLLPFSFKTNRNLSTPGDDALRSLMEEFLLGEVDLYAQAMNLSGGQRQRLCLLRSMLLSPEVMLLDEPVSALDPESRRAVERTVVKLNRERGLTVILVSHQELTLAGLTPVVYSIQSCSIRERKDP